MEKGQQLTPNIVARIRQVVKNYYEAKGFKNVVVTSSQQPDLSKENYDFLTVNVDRQNKVKVHKIYFSGNNVLSDGKLKRTLKKTNENGNILNLFKQKNSLTPIMPTTRYASSRNTTNSATATRRSSVTP